MSQTCTLCFHHCQLDEGQTGFCRARAGRGDKIVPLVHVCEAGYTVELTNGEGATYAVVKLQEA